VGSVREGSGGASARNSWTGPPLPPRVSPAAAVGGRPRVPSLASIKVIVDGSAVSPGPVAGGSMHTLSGRGVPRGSAKSAGADLNAGAAGGAGGEEGRYTGTASSTPSPARLQAAPPQAALAPKRSVLHFAADGAATATDGATGAADSTAAASDAGCAGYTVAGHGLGSNTRDPRLSFTPAASRQGVASVQMASMPAMTVRAPAGARARLGGASSSQRSADGEGVDGPR